MGLAGLRPFDNQLSLTLFAIISYRNVYDRYNQKAVTDGFLMISTNNQKTPKRLKKEVSKKTSFLTFFDDLVMYQNYLRFAESSFILFIIS